ncbi:MAG: CDP-glycerol glycerophosphotransferase family protein [Chitinispirillaceae bacterium]|nr:CDP-glycerol glycerophosphotransferase family protein [Chitinispirillaceae bacterium]
MIKVLFELVHEYYWPAMEPVYEVLAKDSNYDLWMKIGPNHTRFLGIFLIPQKSMIEAGFRDKGMKITDTTAGFDIVICGDALKHPERYGKAFLCNVDHGPCFKTLRYRNLLRQPGTRYVVFAEGRYRMEKLKKYGLDKFETCFDVGLPKLDPFFWGRYSRREIVAKYHLDPAKKIVLYAPTYKPTSIFLVGRHLCSLLPEFNVIVKLHPYSWSGKYAPHRQHRLFERLARENGGLHLVPRSEHNIMPYLFAADTMISEGSSVINEFLALERCGIIFNLNDRKLKHSDGDPLLEEKTTDWLKDSFIHISNGEQLLAAVREAVNPSPERKQSIRRDCRYIYSCNDGTSSQRVKQVIEQLLGTPQPTAGG